MEVSEAVPLSTDRGGFSSHQLNLTQHKLVCKAAAVGGDSEWN